MRAPLLSLGLLVGIARAAETPAAPVQPAPAPAAAADGQALSPLARMRLVRLLVPADPYNRVHDRLPASRVLNEVELESTYREHQAGTYLGVVTWKDLMVNFALRSRYAEARDCLNRSLKGEEVAKAESGIYLAWFLEQLGDYKTAMTGYEELIDANPSDLVLQQRRVGCLIALYRPEAARQALETLDAETGRAQDGWSFHMRALMDLLENDVERAQTHFLQAWRKGGRQPLPETAAGLALLARLRDAPDEAIGWLKRAMTGNDQRFNVRLIHHEAWAVLHGHPAFQEAVVRERWPFNPSVPVEEQLIRARTAGASAYLGQNRLPEGYVAPLKLQQHEAGTRVRTLTGLGTPEATPGANP